MMLFVICQHLKCCCIGEVFGKTKAVCLLSRVPHNKSKTILSINTHSLMLSIPSDLTTRGDNNALIFDL